MTDNKSPINQGSQPDNGMEAIHNILSDVLSSDCLIVDDLMNIDPTDFVSEKSSTPSTGINDEKTAKVNDTETFSIDKDSKNLYKWEAKKVIVDTLKGQHTLHSQMSQLIRKRDALVQGYSDILLTMTDNDEGGKGMKMNIIITEVNSHLEKLEKLLKPGKLFSLGNGGTQDSKWTPYGSNGQKNRSGRGGLSISRSDLPKLQLKSTPKDDRPFSSEEAYDSVEHFLRTFENVVFSANLNIQEVWRFYIPLTVSYDYDSFVKNKLAACTSWNEARKLIEAKFSDSQTRLQARRDVMNIRMHSHEAAEDYALRFGRYVKNANYSRHLAELMSEAFFFGLPEEWQTNINTVMLST